MFLYFLAGSLIIGFVGRFYSFEYHVPLWTRVEVLANKILFSCYSLVFICIDFNGFIPSFLSAING